MGSDEMPAKRRMEFFYRRTGGGRCFGLSPGDGTDVTERLLGFVLECDTTDPYQEMEGKRLAISHIQ